MKDEIEDITAGYTPAPCGFCRSMGVLHIAIAGDTCGNAQPVERNHIAPYGYVALSTIPCDCDRGKKYAAARQKLANPEKVATAMMPSGGVSKRRQWLLRECVFSDPWQADWFVKCCLAEKEGKPHPVWKTMGELMAELMGTPGNKVAKVAVAAMSAGMAQKASDGGGARAESPKVAISTPMAVSGLLADPIDEILAF